MIRSEARTLLSLVINRASNSTRWGLDELNLCLQQGNNEVWYHVAKKGVSHLLARVSFTFPSTADRVDLSGVDYIGSQWDRVIRVVSTPNSGAPGPGNVPSDLEPVDFPSSGGIAYPLGYSIASTSYPWNVGTWRYAIQGNYLYVVPGGTQQNLTVEYVPVAPNLSDGATPYNNVLLGGQLLRLHQLVVLEAALTAFSKSEEAIPEGLATKLKQEREMRDSYLATPRTAHRPRSVRMPYGP